MPNLSRGIATAAGAVAESYGNIERERIEQRHKLALERVRNKYAGTAREDTQMHDLHRQEQASKYRISEYQMEQKDRRGAEERKHERGVASKDKQYAHEIEKAKIMAAGRGSGATSARMSLTNSVWENLKAVRPDEDQNELWLEAFKLTNEKKEMSPEAEIRSIWNEVYTKATSDPIFGKSEEEATAMADAAAEAYKDKWYPDVAASRERFKKQARDGKALADTQGRDPKKIRDGKALADTNTKEALDRKERFREMFK